MWVFYFGQMKRFFLILAVVTALISCQESSDRQNGRDSAQVWVELKGNTMGTTYSIIYFQEDQENYQAEIDSILIDFNNSLSTYIPNSLVSLVNRRDSSFAIDVDQYFYNVFMKSREVYDATQGAFDPTVMPLVNFWGFGYEPDAAVDTNRLDSLRQLIRFDQFNMTKIIIPDSLTRQNDTSYRLEKNLPYIQLDFSAIAKGYGVDVICEFLENKGISDYFVEIGGEVNTRGTYKENKAWKIGIEKPENTDLTERKIFAVIGLSGQAIATSGNYRNFREINGRRVAHTINPKTGYPEITNLLSASIIAPDCMTADAYATASMVLGIDKAFNLISSLPDLEGFFIYLDDQGNLQHKYTPGFEILILEDEAN